MRSVLPTRLGKTLRKIGIVASAALVSGTMLCLALPLGEQWYLAWFMLVPLLLATKGTRFIVGFLGGLGAVFWCAFLAQTGVFYRDKLFDASPMWIYCACGIFAFSFSIFFGIYAEGKNHERPVGWLGACAVLLEAVLLLEIPAHVALTQYRNTIMMLAAALGGIWLVSFLVWAFNLWIAKDVSRRWLWVLALLFAFVFLNRFNMRWTSSPEAFSVAAVQFNSTNGDDDALIATHREASNAGPAFVVWPEFAGMAFAHGNDTSKLRQLTTNSAPIVTTYSDDFSPLPHNVSSLVADGNESERYEKRKLFGSESKMHTAGTHASSAKLPKYYGRVGLNICYDSCFPAFIRESATQPDVRILSLPTIDPDCTHYFMAAMHAAYTPFRAAESGVAMVRADGTYGSMIVDEYGHIVAELHNEQMPVSGEVSANQPWTPYRQFGDWFLWTCGLMVVVGQVLAIREKKRTKEPIQSNEENRPPQLAEGHADSQPLRHASIDRGPALWTRETLSTLPMVELWKPRCRPLPPPRCASWVT